VPLQIQTQETNTQLQKQTNARDQFAHRDVKPVSSTERMEEIPRLESM
jgi:hypothetical protein